MTELQKAKLSEEELLVYNSLDPEEQAQYSYFMGFTTHTAENRITSNKEILMYQDMTDKITLKSVAQMLEFVPHMGQQPIFYTFDEKREIYNNIVMVLGRRAQTLDSVIKTPSGDITFKDIKQCDVIFDPDGGLQTVQHVHNIYDGDVYEVQVGNRKCKVDSEHLFTVLDHHNNERILEVKHLLKYYKVPRKNNHYKFCCKLPSQQNKLTTELKFKVKNHTPLDYPKANLPIHPYLLGLLLGDGCITQEVRLGMQDKDAIQRGLELQGLDCNIIEEKPGYYMVALGMLKPILKELELLGTYSNSKFIPNQYLTSSIEQRTELLRGLMDTDGCVVKLRNKTTSEYVTVSSKLADGYEELVYSLGGDCTRNTKMPTFMYKGVKKEGQLAYRFYTRLPLNPFWIQRKAGIYKVPKELYNFIKDITKLPSEPVRCITVSGDSETYITDGNIRTHNTGKSVSTSVIATRELMIPFSSTILLTPTFNNAKVIFNEVLKHVQVLKLPIKNINKGSFRFELTNGARFSANSASNIESALGTANSLIICDESQSIPGLEDILKQMLVPTLLDYGTRASGILYGRQIYLGTSRGPDNQLYDLFLKEEDFSNWKSFNAPSTTNPILPKSYFEQMRLDLGEFLYRQEILAEFIGTDDNVFYAFGEHNLYTTGNVKFTRDTDYVVGIDVGFKDSTAGVWLYRDGRGYYYLDKAYSESQKATSVHVSSMKALDSAMLGTVDLRYMDPSAAQLICDYIVDYDYQVCTAKNAVQESIKYINQLLTPTGANEVPRLYVNSELTEVIRQMKRIRWKDNTSKTAKEPFSKDSKGTHWDIIAAIRYALFSDQHSLAAGNIIIS